MKMRGRRIFILIWMLVSVLVTIVVDIIVLTCLTDKQEQTIGFDILLELTISVALFLGFYCVPFLFKRNKYPYVTCAPGDYDEGWLSRIAFVRWTWLGLFPLLFAVAPSIIYFVMIGSSNLNDASIFHSALRIAVLVVVMIVMIGNYAGYLYVLNGMQTSLDAEFVTKINS